jgi:hypothetical protein
VDKSPLPIPPSGMGPPPPTLRGIPPPSLSECQKGGIIPFVMQIKFSGKMTLLSKIYVIFKNKFGNFFMNDIIDRKFNRLKVIKPVWIKKQKKWECICDCGTIKNYSTTDLISGKIKSCGCYNKEVVKLRMTGENNPSWKGGDGIVNKRGYKVIKHGEYRGKLEHRIVYEQHYGIKLLPHQNIHHINGVRTDNRIENLELWDDSQPSGQRVEDKIEFYFNLVSQYKDHPKYKEYFIPIT